MKKWKNDSEKEEKGLWVFLVIMAILIVAWFVFIVPSPVPVNPLVIEEPPAPEEPLALPVTEAPTVPVVVTPIEEPVVESPATPTPPVEEPTPEEPPTVEAPPVKEEEPTPPVPEIPSNFIVPDEAWQNASLLYLKDGSPFNGAVGFSEIPVGTRLYAPISGYVRYFSTTPDESGRVASEVYLVQDASWDPLSPSPDIRVMVFAAQKLEITNYEPKKGEHFAIITDNTELIDHLYKWRDGQIRMAVIVNEAWGISDRAITDPRDYLRVNIQN